jgi:hypothetical protein
MQSSTHSFFPVPDPRTCMILDLQWQCLRRNEGYKRDRHECLRNMQALHDQWIAERQARPRPALSTPASAVATAIDERLRFALAQTYRACPPTLEVKRPLLSDWVLDNDFGGPLQALSAEERCTVAKEVIAYWEWEDEHRRLNDYIGEHTIFIDALRRTTNVLRSWDAPLESLLPAEFSELPKLYQDMLNTFAQICCSRTILERYPSVATLRQRWHILLPLDPGIPALPFRAAFRIFPDIPTHAITVARPASRRSVTYHITVGPSAINKAILTELGRLLTIDTPMLRHGRAHQPQRVKRLWRDKGDLDYYATLWRIHDLHDAGVAVVDIARQVFPKDFQNITEPYKANDPASRRITQRVKDFLKKAIELRESV